MTEFNAKQVDNIDKPLKGIEDKGLVFFKCEDCGNDLLVLQLTALSEETGAEIITRVAVKCGDCGGFSYVKQITGQFHAGAPNDNTVFDIATDSTGAPDNDVLFESCHK